MDTKKIQEEGLEPCKCGVKPMTFIIPASMGDPNLYCVIPQCKCELKKTLLADENRNVVVEDWNNYIKSLI